jgi:hypothetical protein
MGPIQRVIPVSGEILDDDEVLSYCHVQRRSRFRFEDTVIRRVPPLLRSRNKSIMLLNILP